MDAIAMHLAHYANDKRCTLVIMGDVNTDLTKDDGRDLPHFKRMLTDLSLVSAAQRRWKAASLHFKTRNKGDEVHQPSHIDYIMVPSRSVSAIKAFGVAAPADLMVDYDHSVLFCDLDVAQLLELGARKPAADLPQRHKPQMRYSDKKRVARGGDHLGHGDTPGRPRWGHIPGEIWKKKVGKSNQTRYKIATW